MQQQDPIDYNILSFLQPPLHVTVPDIVQVIQQKFYSQCQQFLKSQKKFYQCSKKIENRLNNSIKESVTLDDRVRDKSNHIQRIQRQLNKINHSYEDSEKRQEFLATICRFVDMEDARKVILQTKIVDQSEFINKLKQIDALSQQLSSLQSDIKIISQLKQQINSLLQETADKMIKGSLSDNLIRRITSDFAEPFLRDSKTSAAFLSNLTNQRLNKFRIALNPLINNISYVQNVTELYEKIAQNWIKLIHEELNVFNRQGNRKEIRNITKQVMSKLISEIIPKMERGIFKIKSIIEVSKIRHSMIELKNNVQKCGQGVWDPLSKLLIKMLIILEQKLQENAEQLEIAKYNVHSLVSYVPIREHLQLIKQAKQYEPNNKQIGWERGFKRLTQSRDPSKQPNNKSLLIFNLNIWYLYTHVMKEQGELIQKAHKMIKQCIASIVNLNLAGLKKQNETKSLQKLLDLCADPQSTKKILQSQINLLGHQKLRVSVEKQLVSSFVQQIYSPILKQFKLENGLPNQQVLELAKKEKLNLNKYGKGSQTIKVYNCEEMRELLS